VRLQRHSLERPVKPDDFRALAVDDSDILAHRDAGAPSQPTDEEVDANRFAMLELRAQSPILQARRDFLSLRQIVQTIVMSLEHGMAIPAITAETGLIPAVASDDWLDDVTMQFLATARSRNRNAAGLGHSEPSPP
jgi:hypothetical protein